MIQYEFNTSKLACLIEELAEKKNHLTNKKCRARLNTLIEAHSIVTGTKPEYYYCNKRNENGPAKDYHAD